MVMLEILPGLFLYYLIFYLLPMSFMCLMTWLMFYRKHQIKMSIHDISLLYVPCLFWGINFLIACDFLAKGFGNLCEPLILTLICYVVILVRFLIPARYTPKQKTFAVLILCSVLGSILTWIVPTIDLAE